MLEGSKHSTRCISAQGQYIFDFKTKQPLLSLGAIPYLKPVCSLELASDLENCLEVINSPASEELVMDLSWPATRLSTISSNHKLNIFPESIDYSKLLSFESDSPHDSHHNSMELTLEKPKLAHDEEKDNDVYFIADMDPGYAELEKVITSDNTEAPSVVQPKSGILNEIFRSRLLSAQSVNDFFVNANQMRIRVSYDDILKCRLLTANVIKDILREEQLDLPTTQSSISSHHLAFYKMNLLSWQKLHEFSPPTSDENMNHCQPGQNLKLIGMCLDNTEINIDSPQEKHFDNLKSTRDNQVRANGHVDDLESTESNVDLTIDPVVTRNEKLEGTLKTFLDISDPGVIRKTGVQIFRKETKLFAFDSKKQWLKKGEGLIEVWRQPSTGNCYILLWDQNSQDLLVHVPVDGKWSVKYSANASNSCHWLYYNFANCPQGVHQPLSCCFTDADVASQFVHTVANCVKTPIH